MYFGGLLLLIQPLLVAVAAVKSPSAPKRVGGSDFFAITTDTSPLTIAIRMGQDESRSPMLNLRYVSTTYARKPVLEIRASIEGDEKKSLEKQPVSTIIKAVTSDYAKIKLDQMPYVIYQDYQLWELVRSYASESVKLRGRPGAFSVTPKDEWWLDYKNTDAFKTISQAFIPRYIAEIRVEVTKKSSFKQFRTIFILQKK
ncbi:hypothetical protein LX32DRAFT_320635 [Colletotrichum zoysiae]|uniref:Uncharacterized protein n=1 Tax=Colletotrichum zoysiae TaxID=1216348 RepID=A0AAD9M1E2_9PEZI|nr:hypothetical protein LX32DRAFT_320635 [Colletotrichum zoysiae]